MFKNLLLVALRNFKKDKWYTLLNIVGLTIGITFSLLLIFYIKDELGFDRQNLKGDRIFRVATYNKEADHDTAQWAITPYPLGPALKKDYPEVEEAVRFAGDNRTMYRHGDTRFYEDKVFFCDSNIFRVFTCNFLEGDPNTALIAPKSMVLTQSVAKKYFGKQRAIGKTLTNDKGDVYNVTGVIGDVPKNSHLIFNVLISANTLPKEFGNNWGNFGFYTYVLLKEHTDYRVFEHKLLPIYGKYLAAIFEKFNIKIRFILQPVFSIHLHSNMVGEPEELGNISYVYIFSAVALFMLIIACINYMNLTTARSARRAKEIGIRKVTGSGKSQLVLQFLLESLLTALFALVVSIGVIVVLLPMFNTLSGKTISFTILMTAGNLAILGGIICFVGLLGGSYPAFYLAKFNPINILKGSLSKSSGNVALRRTLVVIQFTISIVMMICTWVVADQLRFLHNKDLGFNKEQVLSLTANANYDIRSKILAFTNDALKNPKLGSVSTSETVPGGPANFILFSVQTNKGYVDKGIDCYGIDDHYLKTLGMRLAAGRDFSGPADTLRSIIVNENFVRNFGWDNPIGKRVKNAGDTSSNYYEVVGVVKDFNQKSLYNPIAPLMLFYRPNSSVIELKLRNGDVASAISGIEHSWKAVFPDLPFTYTFLDQDFQSQYAADQKRGKIFVVFSIATIFITCLGLLGLTAFTTEQRQKEISIRKVLGAGIFQIVRLISGGFLALVGLSCVIAFPIAYLFMSNWLKIFSYSTGMSASPFLASAFSVLAITLLTVIFHAVKAAIANPAIKLRSD